MKKYRRAIALFLAIGLMVLIPSGMGVSASGNIRDAAVWAADQVPGYHTAPIKFIGDRTYRGFV